MTVQGGPFPTFLFQVARYSQGTEGGCSELHSFENIPGVALAGLQWHRRTPKASTTKGRVHKASSAARIKFVNRGMRKTIPGRQRRQSRRKRPMSGRGVRDL